MALQSFTGRSGELRRAYRLVAVLGRWQLTSKHRLEADLVRADPYEWAQEDGSLTLRLDLGSKAWTYTDVIVIRRESPIVVKLTGPPAVRG